jgi:peptide/nickel transport system ATP-binding protein
MRDLRGNRMAMIFQEPMTSLNPSYTVGDQIMEVIVRHRGLSHAGGAGAQAIEMLHRARIS